MDPDSLRTLQRAMDKGLALEKCRACGCMAGVLADLERSEIRDYSPLLAGAAQLWREQTVPTRHVCLGCDPCHAAEASNALAATVPNPSGKASVAFPANGSQDWPPVPGEYHVAGRGTDRPVAVSTLACPALAAALAAENPRGLCIAGKTETENLGVEKVVRNLLATPEVRFLVLAGMDSVGHRPGETLLALARSGVDRDMRVIGSPAPRPILINLAPLEVERFRAQVRVVDMAGCQEIGPLLERVAELACEAASDSPDCGCGFRRCPPRVRSGLILEVSEESREASLDPAGYFVILPERESATILVEHYDYENRLLRSLRGQTARALCQALLRGGWVSRADHAAYLGRELVRAEIALRSGGPFVQDRA